MYDTIIELARRVKRKRQDQTSAAIAKDLNISEGLVNEILPLLDLAPDIQVLVESGRLSRQTALRIRAFAPIEHIELAAVAVGMTDEEFVIYMETSYLKKKSNRESAKKALDLGERIIASLKTKSFDDVLLLEGCTMTCLVNRLHVRDLSDKAMKLFKDGKMDLANAIELSKLPSYLQDSWCSSACVMTSIEFDQYISKMMNKRGKG